MDRHKLNPPPVPMCEEYERLYWAWIGTPEALKDNRIMALGALFEHRRDCPQCQARMKAMNELAKNATHPEVK